jgi:3-deoxy-D-manno-octulosonic-acid transferase
MRRMFLLYEVMLHLVFILSLPFFLVVGFIRGKYLTNFRERFGHYVHAPEAHDLWIHAVSVGEVMAARTIFDEVRAQRPATTLVLTTTTITGQQTARRLFKGATVTYFPFDFSRTVHRFLDHHSPRALLLVETEIWPNVTRIAAKRNLPILLANGRISDRSFGKYRAVRFLLGGILRLFRSFLVREELDRERFVAIGAPADRVHVAGNVKFDFTPDSTPLEIEPALLRLCARRPLFVFGSTVVGEDEMLLPLIDELRGRGSFVVIAPRKPERFDIVDGLLADSGLRYVRRSEWDGSDDREADVVLLDSIGELARLYRDAAGAFVGGSLLPGTGGHNPIEPAAVGVPVAFGPYMSNFREIAATFTQAGAARQVTSVGELSAFFRELLDDDAKRAELGERAQAVVAKNQGAAKRIAGATIEALA